MEGTSRGWSAGILFAAIAAAHVAICVCGSAATNDDAFISFRYSRNLVEGKGLVFNEGERVEGYTNFLWVLIIGAAMKVTDPVLAAKVLGVACNVATIGLLLRACLGWLEKIWWLPPLMLAIDPSFATWATRGLETSLFALLAFASFHAAGGERARAPQTAAILALLATLTRPEGVLVAAAAGIGWYWKAPRKLAAFGVTYAIALAPYLVWKLVYFGDVLPNTYYAKTGGGVFQAWRGLAYVAYGWRWPHLLLGVAIVLGLAFPRWGRHPALVASAVVLALFLAYVIQVGGDSLGRDRFLAPLMPYLLLGVALSIASLSKGGNQVELAFAPLLFFVPIIGSSVGTLKSPEVYSRQREAGERDAVLGNCLASIARPGDSIATSLIGRVPYYSGLRTFDKLGLVDPHIAHLPATGSGAAGHEKFDPEYILSKRPTYILGGKLGEVMVGAPPEVPWVKWLRTHVSGDPPQPPRRSMKPDEHGYVLTTLPCKHSAQVWELKS